MPTLNRGGGAEWLWGPKNGITAGKWCLLDMTEVVQKGLSTIKAVCGRPAQDCTIVCQHTWQRGSQNNHGALGSPALLRHTKTSSK